MLTHPLLKTTTKDSTPTCACTTNNFLTNTKMSLDWRKKSSHFQNGPPTLPFPSLGFFFIPNSGDPLEIGDCWVFGLRPTEKIRYWNHTLKTGKIIEAWLADFDNNYS